MPRRKAVDGTTVPAGKRKSRPVVDHHGEMVDVSEMSLDFGARRKGSIYDQELDALIHDTRMSGTPQIVARKFKDKSCKTQLLARARKRGIQIEMAVAPDGLYVRLAPAQNSPVPFKVTTSEMSGVTEFDPVA